MKILILGNSQAGALKRAHDAEPERLKQAGITPHFFVVPGGMGPDLSVSGDRLKVGKVTASHPPYSAPAGTEKMPVSSFDAILFSALGYFDGGFAFNNPITSCGVLAQFGPRGVALRRAPVSDRCFAETMAALFERQGGIRSLRAVAAAFDGPVLVQPFPVLSEQILEHQGWQLRQWYQNPLEAYRFMNRTRDEILARIASEIGCRILPRPDIAGAHDLTARAFMRESDCVHQSDALGALVLDQLRMALAPA